MYLNSFLFGRFLFGSRLVQVVLAGTTRYSLSDDSGFALDIAVPSLNSNHVITSFQCDHLHMFSSQSYVLQHHSYSLPRYLRYLPTVRHASPTQTKKHLVVVVQSVKSHTAADFVLGGVAIGRVAWIR